METDGFSRVRRAVERHFAPGCLVTPTRDDLMSLSWNIHPVDREELESLSNTPLETVLAGMWKNPTMLFQVNREEERYFFGVRAVPTEHLSIRTGMIWFLCNERGRGVVSSTRTRGLLMVGSAFTDYVMREFDAVFNYILCKNEPYLRMVEHLGFEVARSHPMEIGSGRYYGVARSREFSAEEHRMAAAAARVRGPGESNRHDAASSSSRGSLSVNARGEGSRSVREAIVPAVLLAGVTLAGCGGSDPGAEEPRIIPVALARPHVPDAMSEEAIDCVLDATFEEGSCTLEQLPLIGDGSTPPTVEDIRSRMLVTHDWMGERLSELLAVMPPVMLGLFAPVTAVVVGSDVRPSAFKPQSAALYIDPALPLARRPRAGDGARPGRPARRASSGARADAAEQPPHRRREHRFDRVSQTEGEREIDDLLPAVTRLLAHELAHANDAIRRDRRSPRSIAPSRCSISCWKGSARRSPRNSSTPIRSVRKRSPPPPPRTTSVSSRRRRCAS